MKPKLTKRRTVTIVICIVLIIALIYAWLEGQTLKTRLLSLIQGAECISSPIAEIIAAAEVGRDTRPLCLLSERDSFSDMAIIKSGLPIDDAVRGTIDYLALEDIKTRGIQPIVKAGFSCDSDKLECSEDHIIAKDNVRFYISPSCHPVDVNDHVGVGSSYNPNIEVLSRFMSWGQECEFQAIELSDAEASSRLKTECPAPQGADALEYFQNEIWCDYGEPIAEELRAIKTRTEGALPPVLWISGAGDADFMYAGTEFTKLGALSGLLGVSNEMSYELNAFKNGAIDRFSDGTETIESHFLNLKAKAEETWAVFKAAPRKVVEEWAYPFYDLEEWGARVLEREVVKLGEDQARGDLELGTIRAQFIIEHQKTNDWIFQRDAHFEFDPATYKYKTANCMKWLLNHPEADSVWCGSVFMPSDSILAVEDVLVVEGLENLTIGFDIEDQSANHIFEIGSYLDFDGQVITSINDASFGIRLQKNSPEWITIYFGNP